MTRNASENQILTTSISRARKELTDLHDHFGLIPDHAVDATWEAVGSVEQSAAKLGLDSCDDLVANCSNVLTELTGLRAPTQFQPVDLAPALHTYRNAVATLVAAAAVTRRAEPAGALKKVTHLKKRTHELNRCASDDEVVLLRASVLAEVLHRQAHRRTFSRPVITYTLCDAGMNPGESTGFTAEHLQVDADIPTVTASGNRNLEDRQLPLDTFNRFVLQASVDSALKADHLTPTTTLSYAPRANQPGSKQATASAFGVLDRQLKTVGIDNLDLKASCIYRWRVDATRRTLGLTAAQTISGHRSLDGMFRAIGMSPDSLRRAPAPTQVRFDA
ncbi:hypothetical protein [Mumia sp. DW29H23]|uniref:hypothetical protein n=1 Tax=Mumia sp. DW29H23 TaxID=3421241 RepID=UPI003D698019